MNFESFGRKGLIIYALLVSGIVWGQATDVVCDGCVNPKDLADRAVQRSKIANFAVNTPKLNNFAVTTAKIKPGAITAEKIAPELAAYVDSGLSGLIFLQTSLSDGSGVSSLACPAASLVASASCGCEGIPNVRNFGVLFSCEVAGNGGVAGCFNEALTYNQFLLPPIATVTLTCVYGTTLGGQIIVPIPLGGSITADADKGAQSLSEEENALMLEIADEEMRRTVSDYNSALQTR